MAKPLSVLLEILPRLPEMPELLLVSEFIMISIDDGNVCRGSRGIDIILEYYGVTVSPILKETQ